MSSMGYHNQIKNRYVRKNRNPYARKLREDDEFRMKIIDGQDKGRKKRKMRVYDVYEVNNNED